MSPESIEPKSDDIVVFEILRDSACAECGDELGKGRWLRLEKERPLCMSCADLGHLVFLPRGDAALTRRASRYSSLKAWWSGSVVRGIVMSGRACSSRKPRSLGRRRNVSRTAMREGASANGARNVRHRVLERWSRA